MAPNNGAFQALRAQLLHPVALTDTASFPRCIRCFKDRSRVRAEGLEPSTYGLKVR
ncbi:hypothetical protein Plim_4276 (plasmid) [Planctopirus limnophila DSM 3776]|uniref:Uncharacterized protein n=1 Tax=Planctopirus limnophila (strain ATCC 43296 / DSM 3776 / IFAM 1008 / Mu 290) TaxID=521674 RepID=D5SZG3_PLAL2|nr:hypothetical protein Plim_4276 [Planctopirus limnophila DSM 3776]